MMTEEQSEVVQMHPTHEGIANVIATQQTPESTAIDVLKQGLVDMYGEQKAAEIMADMKKTSKSLSQSESTNEKTAA